MSSKDHIEEKMRVSLDRSEFNEWYLNVVKEANLCDNRYPIKGMNVWTAYGWKVMLPLALANVLVTGAVILTAGGAE